MNSKAKIFASRQQSKQSDSNDQNEFLSPVKKHASGIFVIF